MSIGRRHTKIVIQEKQGDVEDDNAGVGGGSWVALKTIWGRVIPGGGKREFEAGQLNGKVPYQLEISYNQNLVSDFIADEGMSTRKKRFVLVDGTTITPHSVINKDLRNRTILITGWTKPVAI